MKENALQLHIVSFTIPYPADFGGAIDVFYRLKALHQIGVKIHLHCFQYGRNPSTELQKYCENVFYYKRKKGILPFLSSSPYIVETRTSDLLLQRLRSTKAPILFEGEHTTDLIDHSDLSKYPKFVRLHNIEHQYYRRLAQESTSPFNKLYFLLESYKLKRYETRLSMAQALFPISTSEITYFKKVNDHCHWLPAFHSGMEPQNNFQKKNTYLYHGDLTIVFNQNVVNAVAELFKGRSTQLTIAGKMTAKYKSGIEQKFPHIMIHDNPEDGKMMDILSKNAIHLIFAEHEEGVKLKLIHSLLSGARVIANSKAVMGSHLSDGVQLMELKELKDFLDEPERIFEHEQGNIQTQLSEYYDNMENAEKLRNIILSYDT